MKWVLSLLTLLISTIITLKVIIPFINYFFCSQNDSGLLKYELKLKPGFTDNVGFIPEDLEIADTVEGTTLQLLAWDVNARSPRLFTEWAYNNIGETDQKVDSTMKLLDMTWASANTPLYFTPASIEGEYYISGDNSARSPAMFSYMHAFLAS